VAVDYSSLKLTACRFSGPMIKVISKYYDEPGVMAEQVKQAEFWVPRDLLRQSSKFFQAATRPEWDALRDDKHTVTIDFKDHELFEAYVHWLYEGTIPCPCSDLKEGKDHHFLAKLYVMAEELMDVKLKNAILDIFAALTTEVYPGAIVIKIIYEGTSAGSPARRLLADFCAHVANNNWLDDFHQYPHEALVDALKAMAGLRKKPNSRPWNHNRYYHEQQE